MIEALPNLSVAPLFLLTAVALGGLGLRRWGGRWLALIGATGIWLAFCVALAWAGTSVLQLLSVLGK